MTGDSGGPLFATHPDPGNDEKVLVGIVKGANDMEIYIDCENDGGSYLGSGGALNYLAQPGSIGRKDIANLPTYYFDGAIDEFRYWSRAITEDEITLLCNEEVVDIKNQIIKSDPYKFKIIAANHRRIEEVQITLPKETA